MAQGGDTFESLLQRHQYKVVFRDPESILKKYLGNVIIFGYGSEPFSKIGDNYGSTMMKITVSLKKKDEGKVKKLELVAKMLPPTDMQRQMFESDYTFPKEVFFYEQLIPTYRSIYNKEFNIVPQYYGSRLSLKSETGVMDEDAALLLENLKVKDYYMEDRHKGLDLKHLKIIIPAIAKFHAIGLAVKKKNPAFLPVLEKYTRRLASSASQKQIIEKMISDIEKNPEVNKYYRRIRNLHDNFEDKKTLGSDEPWACVVHLDLWTNNMLFHRDEYGKIDDVKIVDFQTYTMASPLLDLIFLLCTSMQYSIEHFDTMIELYRKTAYEVLQELDCDVSLFVKEKFEERLKVDAITEIFHIITMTNAVEYRRGDNFINNPSTEYVIRRWKQVFEIYEHKEWF